jgi:hypothetical protein
MPEELRPRLSEAAARAGRSLNAELVHRLESSLEDEASSANRPGVAWLHRMTKKLEGRNWMTRKRKRLTLAGFATIVLAVVAGSAVLMAPGTASQAARAEGEGPPALAAHLAKLKQALPGNQGMALEGPGSAAAAEYAKRAYPDNVISVTEMNAAAASATAASTRFFRGQGQRGRWVFAGPSEALYPFERFRNSFLYVPNTYVAGGRTTAIAIDDQCLGRCTAYVTPAGGGVWRTDDVFAKNVKWEYLGGPLGINAAGAVTIDPNDPTRRTIYVGTGEANICGSGCVAGAGLYKSTNKGNTWTKIGDAEFTGKGIGAIVVKPGDSNTIYAGTTTALRGYSSSCCSGVTRPVPGIAKWGLYKTTNGGASWSFIHNGSANVADCTGSLLEFQNAGICSPRGVRHVELDPANSDIVYASSYARGIWRSTNAGATWAQIKPSLNPAVIQTRAAIDVTRIAGATRMYAYEGNNGTDTSRLFRSDNVDAGIPVFTDLTSPTEAAPGWAWHAACDPQCWYDMFVHTPTGHPDMVYVGGDYSYGENTANKRGVVLSTDAGVSGTDMTFDGTDSLHPNGIHPDQHDIATNPHDPFQFVETGDGGVIRSNGRFVNRSAWCSDPSRRLNAVQKARCEQMLSRIPERLTGINGGLGTLQFQSLSVSPHNVKILQGGTQDNGTWEGKNYQKEWRNTMIGDGGQSGFDVAIPSFRFHNFTGASPDVNFENGDFERWIWTGDPLQTGGEFYAPVIGDPVVSKTMFAGTNRTAYRTKTAGLGTRTIAEAHTVCNEWTGNFSAQCGDWAELGNVRLTDAAWGDRAGGAVAAVERTKDDASTAWAATSTGRVFVSKNVDAGPVVEMGVEPPPFHVLGMRRVATSVTWSRIDQPAPATPSRYVTSIYVDPADGNHAWVSYSGYNVNAPGGHLFEVRFNPGTGTATWTNIDHNWGDLPVSDLVYDDVTGDLYASSDFGVSKLEDGTTSWVLAASGMPNVEVPGLTIVPEERKLFAATHGLSAWMLDLH